MISFLKNLFTIHQDISKMRFSLTLLTIFIVSASFAQLKQKTADRYFQYKEYAKCVEMYDELAVKCFENKKNADWENVRKAAISHFHLFDMEEAISYYQKLYDKNMLTEKDRENYIHALRFTGKYGKCEQVTRESANLFPKNAYFKRLNDGADQFKSLFKDSAFYRIRPASINSESGDFGPAYLNNSLVYVSKARNAGFANPKYGYDDDYFLNIMQAKMNDDSSLQAGQLLKHNFLSRAHDGPVSFNADGTEMVITKNKEGKKYGKNFVTLTLYFSKFENGEWTDLVPFEFNSDKYNVGHGVFSPDGSKLYFVSDKPGGIGGTDIYVSERKGSGWTEPKNLGNKINTERNEMFPFVQGHELYFASNGHYGLGGLDIFVANVSGTEDVHNMGAPVNSSADDFSLIFDQSGRLGYFSTNRNDNIDRIYHVKRRVFNIQLAGEVFAQYNELESLPNQMVWIKNMTTQQLDSLVTDDLGKFNKQININENYQIYTRKLEFILLKEAKVSSNGIQTDTTLSCQLILKPTTIQIHLRVVEKETGKIIPMATTTITNYNIDWDTTLITNDQGMVTLKVDRNKVYWAHGAKKGFIDADVSFNTTNENDKVIDLELELPPIKKGEKFRLENIFYDLNKSTLRPESKSSLDKLAAFIIDNNLRIELSAHTDSRGSKSYNQRLSQARAQSCVDYLISKGVKTSSITAKGYGETKLVNRCKDGVECSEEEHQENRRTEVKILEVNR